jgi:lipopolysaccharide exporter
MTHSNKNLGESIARGAAWVTMLRFSDRFIGLVSTIILARLLTPSDFGVVAISMSFYGLVEVFSRMGLETVLVQKKNITKNDYNTAWTLNLSLSLIAAIILAISSSKIGEFYNSEDIRYITLSVSFLFILNGLKNIGTVDFQKFMTFEKEFKLFMLPKILSFFITIPLAFTLRSFWALVIGSIAWKTLETINSYLMHPHRPKLCLKKWRELINFSKWLVISNLFRFAHFRSPEMIIGKIVSPHAAAIFSLANEISAILTREVVASLNRAIYPAYSKVSGDLYELRKLYVNSIQFIYLIVIPVGVGLSLVAEDFVPIFLGDQWFNAIIPLVYLSLGGMFYAMQTTTNFVFLSLAKPKVVSLLSFLKAAFFLLLLVLLTQSDGVVGAAKAFFYSSIVMLIITMYFLQHEIKLSVLKQLKLFFRPAAAASCMTFILLYFRPYFDSHVWLSFGLSIFFGALTYSTTLYVFWVMSGAKDGAEFTIMKKVKGFLK